MARRPPTSVSVAAEASGRRRAQTPRGHPPAHLTSRDKHERYAALSQRLQGRSHCFFFPAAPPRVHLPSLRPFAPLPLRMAGYNLSYTSENLKEFPTIDGEPSALPASSRRGRRTTDDATRSSLTLHRVVEPSGIGPSYRAFEDVDADDDGVITRSEYEALHYATWSPTPGAAALDARAASIPDRITPTPMLTPTHDVRRACPVPSFDHFDENKDGVITRSEYEKAHPPRRASRPSVRTGARRSVKKRGSSMQSVTLAQFRRRVERMEASTSAQRTLREELRAVLSTTTDEEWKEHDVDNNGVLAPVDTHA